MSKSFWEKPLLEKSQEVLESKKKEGFVGEVGNSSFNFVSATFPSHAMQEEKSK